MSLEDHKFRKGKSQETSEMYNASTFNARMEDANAEQTKVVIYGREVVDIEVQGRQIFLYPFILIVLGAWARARAQRKQPHPYCFVNPSRPQVEHIFQDSQSRHLQLTNPWKPMKKSKKNTVIKPKKKKKVTLIQRNKWKERRRSIPQLLEIL